MANEAPVKRVKMRLLRGYFSGDPAFKLNPHTGQPAKLRRGSEHDFLIEEAKTMMGLGIAERADELSL